ncbi:Nucleic acid-binding, OB-fold [Sesbania bispinosa]|nr:Nucleic acid-binding, OB-fold [Sesbania bispinosa]
MTSPSTREIKVKDITDEIDNWVIKVRVLRSWPIFDSIELDDMTTLEVVLIDSEKIQGSIAVEVVCARCFNLNEGEYYEIGCVVVVENDGLERMTDHPFKLVFWSGSIVEPWEPAPFSAYGLNPFTASGITTYRNDYNHLVDIVALCTSISSERLHIIDNRVVKMILLELTDHTGQIECVVYDDYVDQVHDHLKSNGIQTQVVVLHMVRMMPFEPALFGLSVVQVVPNATKLVFNPPIVEHAEEMLTEMEYVRRDPCDVKLVDDFILSYPRRTIRELCVNANVGCYVILATITAIDGNDDWRHLYTNAKPKANERSKFPVSHLHDCLIPRYNVKANVFDGVESRGFYLDDHHVIDYLTKSSSQSIGVDDPFECMVGTQFLFIVKKTCDHKVDQDGCFKTLSFCGDPEILRIFSERDCYLLDSWAKIAMLTSLKKTCPIEDSFLKSNRENQLGVFVLIEF